MSASSSLLSRRTAGAALVFAPALLRTAIAQAQRRPTPSQTEGPFYPVRLPADTDNDLLRNGTVQYGKGQPAVVDGTVTDLQGRPVSGATIEIWQCDQAGPYHHPGDGGRADPDFQGFGRVTVGADGRYRFRTIRPVPYTGRTPHIHVKVLQGQREVLTTQLYVEGDPSNERDGLWRRLSAEDRRAVTVPFRPADGGVLANFPIVLAA